MARARCRLYRLGPLLGSGGCGRVYAGTRLADGALVAIRRVPRDRIWEWAQLRDGALVPLGLVLLSMVSCLGFRGIVQFLDWFQLPDGFALVMERPERCRDLWHLLHAAEFLPEPVARGVFRQVLQAVRHCTSHGVLHRHIKPWNILVDLDTSEAKLIDFGVGTILQDTLYTRMTGRLHLVPGWGGKALALSVESIQCWCYPGGPWSAGTSPSRRTGTSCGIGSSPGSKSPEATSTSCPGNSTARPASLGGLEGGRCSFAVKSKSFCCCHHHQSVTSILF